MQLDNKTTEKQILDPSNHCKVCLALDECICDGIVEITDASTVSNLAKLKL